MEELDEDDARVNHSIHPNQSARHAQHAQTLFNKARDFAFLVIANW